MESTTVISKVPEFKPNKTDKSLLQLIKESSTPTEVIYFLGLGKSYKNAGTKTRKLWEKAATERLTSLRDGYMHL